MCVCMCVCDFKILSGLRILILTSESKFFSASYFLSYGELYKIIISYLNVWDHLPGNFLVLILFLFIGTGHFTYSTTASIHLFPNYCYSTSITLIPKPDKSWASMCICCAYTHMLLALPIYKHRFKKIIEFYLPISYNFLTYVSRKGWWHKNYNNIGK